MLASKDLFPQLTHLLMNSEEHKMISNARRVLESNILPQLTCWNSLMRYLNGQRRAEAAEHKAPNCASGNTRSPPPLFDAGDAGKAKSHTADKPESSEALEPDDYDGDILYDAMYYRGLSRGMCIFPYSTIKGIYCDYVTPRQSKRTHYFMQAAAVLWGTRHGADSSAALTLR